MWLVTGTVGQQCQADTREGSCKNLTGMTPFDGAGYEGTRKVMAACAHANGVLVSKCHYGLF